MGTRKRKSGGMVALDGSFSILLFPSHQASSNGKHSRDHLQVLFQELVQDFAIKLLKVVSPPPLYF